VQFVVESADWAIRRVGTGIRDGIAASNPGAIHLTTNAASAHRQIVHYGSQYMWTAWGHHLSRSNRFATSFFHGKPEDGPDVARHIDQFLKSVPRLDKIVASNGLLRERLLSWNVPAEKIVQIPIGVDTNLFTPSDATGRAAARDRFAIPEGSICIGSFQKDGVGWGDGMEPKFIKGPDLFVDTVTDLARDLPIFVLLTGPARGYVKGRLEEAGIPFTHNYVVDYADLRHAYHALDLYLITSREEGGPMALMESMASHVPVVSTPVGMAPDLITDSKTGWIADIESNALANQARKALTTNDRNNILRAARKTVLRCDWAEVAQSHWEHVYLPLMETL
jgi:glycosyltransferase involved in cell wall biosynthesis